MILQHLPSVRRAQSVTKRSAATRAARRRAALGAASAMVAALLGTACSPGAGDASKTEPLSPLAAEGKQIYAAQCTACHDTNPTRAGSLGPSVGGSSAELLEAKVLRGEYPPGYTPKRDSRAMIPLPHLAGKIPALAAYLETFPAGP